MTLGSWSIIGAAAFALFGGYLDRSGIGGQRAGFIQIH